MRSSSSMVVKTFNPDRIASSNSSVRVSTSRSTNGRWRSGDSSWGTGRLCETSFSWRLSFCEARASGLVATRVSRAVKSRRFQFSTATGTSPPRTRVFLDRIPDPGSRIPDPGSRIPDPGTITTGCMAVQLCHLRLSLKDARIAHGISVYNRRIWANSTTPFRSQPSSASAT